MARGRGPGEGGRKEIEALLEEILVDAHGDDEQLWAFRQAFEDEASLPADAHVIGEPVSVVAIDYDANARRGLSATCRREEGTKHTVPGSEVLFPQGSAGARYIAAYRRWLGLEGQGLWDPAEEHWGEEGKPLEEWARPIVARGPRPAFGMQQVLPGQDRDDPDDDPILQASELHTGGDSPGARKLLMDLLAADLRCLDAHAHLGNFAFDRRSEDALRHYEVGVRIGELSLADGFGGVLPWGHVDNRPFLRCLHGYGLCLWRLGRAGEAAGVFERTLWLNPGDNQGVRFLLPAVRAGARWEDGHVKD